MPRISAYMPYMQYMPYHVYTVCVYATYILRIYLYHVYLRIYCVYAVYAYTENVYAHTTYILAYTAYILRICHTENVYLRICVYRSPIPKTYICVYAYIVRSHIRYAYVVEPYYTCVSAYIHTQLHSLLSTALHI